MQSKSFINTNPANPVVYRIGEAAALSGVSTANIRYYEQEKLLSAHGRSDNSYRIYSKQSIHELRFIRLCRAMDMSLDEVRTLMGLDLANKTHCAVARTALDAHLDHVRERLAELKLLEQDLKAFFSPTLLPGLSLEWRRQRLTLSLDGQMYQTNSHFILGSLFGSDFSTRLGAAYRLGQNPDAKSGRGAF